MNSFPLTYIAYFFASCLLCATILYSEFWTCKSAGLIFPFETYLETIQIKVKIPALRCTVFIPSTKGGTLSTYYPTQYTTIYYIYPILTVSFHLLAEVHVTSNYPIKRFRVKSSKIKKEIIIFVMQIHTGPSSKDPHATSHGWEALPLQPLWSPIRPSSQPASSLARAHWWTSIRVRVMFSQVQWLKSTESSSTDPQGRETIRMRALSDAIQTKAPPDTSQVWHQYQLWTSNEDTGCLSVLGKRRFRWGYRHWYRRRSRGSRSIIIGQQKNKCFS